jgi:hypothetical protein
MVAARWAEIEGGSLSAHRACGTTYAAHSLELKVKASLKFFLLKFYIDLILAPPAL